ncbi:MAG: DUF2207 domain-containing protein [Bacteroidales bacterium]|nr:DUF2207 domain-containing protein [Bacteroidales bacterium]
MAISISNQIRRTLAVVVSLLLGSASIFAQSSAIRSIEIDCVLDSLGSAHITEEWDVCATSGTEWYLVRENLADIEIQDLKVREVGTIFETMPYWDVNASRTQKCRKCGINYTESGLEICWGIGDIGDHVFTVSYVMTHAVKSLDDYDMLHLQFISDGLSSDPQYAKVKVSVEGTPIDTSNVRVWGFGYNGNTSIRNGYVEADAINGLWTDDSMILLLRLDKGVIASPQSHRSMEFQQALDIAFEDSDWAPKSFFQKILTGIVIFIGLCLNGAWVFFIPFYLIIENYVKKRKFLGTSKRNVDWCRDIPFEGDLCATEYVLSQIGEGGNKGYIASAMILRMIQAGAIEIKDVSKKQDGPIDLVLGDKFTLSGYPAPYRTLWDMIYNASGSDHILQNHEFSLWSEKNQKTVSDWIDSITNEGKRSFQSGRFNLCYEGNRVTEKGREAVRRTLGFKKYLSDFTLIKERTSSEAILWDEYIVFGALFGIAEQVAKELKDINPKAYSELQIPDEHSMRRLINQTNRLASSITSARKSYQYSQSGKSGYGGSSSHGGGRGFSGGGRGGGSR